MLFLEKKNGIWIKKESQTHSVFYFYFYLFFFQKPILSKLTIFNWKVIILKWQNHTTFRYWRMTNYLYHPKTEQNWVIKAEESRVSLLYLVTKFYSLVLWLARADRQKKWPFLFSPRFFYPLLFSFCCIPPPMALKR